MNSGRPSGSCSADTMNGRNKRKRLALIPQSLGQNGCSFAPILASRTANGMSRELCDHSALHANFPEVHRRARVVILQPDVAGIRTRPSRRLVPLLAHRDRLVAVKLIHLGAIELDDRLLSAESNVHRVPFARWLLTLLGHFAERIEGSSGVPLVAT